MRTVRQLVPGIVYHLISRFVGRQWLMSDEETRENYLRLLGRALSDSDWRCLSYALMSSHIHLAMVAGEQPLKSWIGRVHTPFAQRVNSVNERIGPVFARGPQDYAAPSHKVGELIAYIHRNPVRARVVKRARASSWTSHRAYAGLVESPRWLHIDEGLTRAGFDHTNFDRWVDSTPGDACRPELGRVRTAARLRGAIEVATPMVPRTPLVARPHAHLRIDPQMVVAITAALLRVTPMELGARGRRPVIVLGRRIAVHAARRLGVAAVDIAAALGVTPSAVSQIGTEVAEPLRESVESVVSRVSLVA
jgi:putative transposase